MSLYDGVDEVLDSRRVTDVDGDDHRGGGPPPLALPGCYPERTGASRREDDVVPVRGELMCGRSTYTAGRTDDQADSRFGHGLSTTLTHPSDFDWNIS